MAEEVVLRFLIFLGLIFSACFHVIIAIILEENDCYIFYTPKIIYEEFGMNWLSTICVYVLIFPFSFMFGIIGFLRWLFTLGRK